MAASDPGDGTAPDAGGPDAAPDTAPDAAPDATVAGARPADGPVGDLARAHLRARLGRMLFDAPAEPLRLGRFVLLDKLGEGGMGVVYSAYDPKLDRRVALKLWRAGSGPGAHERLMREAQALARLSHPNVVPVHDVGVLDGQVFIVMEFVVGATLRDWTQAEPRPFARILDVYLQAGRGLAAAHAVGLVHRDVKPDNALVGSDGRVRVVDFGLVRGGEREDGEPGAAPAALGDGAGAGGDAGPELARADTLGGGNLLQQSLTRTGVRMGTPAYMSPEQFMGERVGPASDQFSFCAALYEALYGEAPFAGATMAEREAEVRAGKLREPPPGSRVPRWVFPVLRRGLQVQPAERWPSMDALLAELGRDRTRARRRALLAVSASALLAVTGYALWRSPVAPAAPACDGGVRAMAEVWNADRRARVEQAIRATGRAYAGPAWTQVATALDGYAGEWAGTHRDACLAHQRGEQSALLLDRRMACLESRREALDSAVAVLAETRAESLGRVVEVARGLPPLATCSRIDALAAEVPPPEDPAVARAVDALRPRLARARALEQAGRYPDGLSEARAVVEAAEPLGYTPLLAEALLVRGHVAMSMRAQDEAIAALDRAVRLGLSTGQTGLAVEAMARRVFAAGLRQDAQQGADVAVYVELGEPLAARLPERAFLRALLFNNAGAAALARGARDEARAHFERALAVMEGTSEPLPIELIHVRSNLAMVTDDQDARARLFAAALRELQGALGADHPWTVWMRAAAGMYRASPAQAHALLAPACTAYQRYHPEILDEVAQCLFELGWVEVELGRPERAVERFAAVVDSLSGHDEVSGRRSLRALARGYTSLHAGDAQAARPSLQAAADEVLPRTEGAWWLDRQAALAWLALGESALALGRRDQAVEVLERAMPVFERLVEKNGNVIQQRGLARARVALAMALHPGAGRAAAPATGARIQALLTAAEQWYRAAGEGYEPRLAELAAWRRTHGVAP
jgi:tetratricopeptide (TPR) repeat protein/predicted Ser/Thr protein kinase